MTKRTFATLICAALSLVLATGCYVQNAQPTTGRDAPVEETGAENGQPQEGEPGGEEGEVPPPAPGTEGGEGGGYEEGNVPVDPGPTW